MSDPIELPPSTGAASDRLTKAIARVHFIKELGTIIGFPILISVAVYLVTQQTAALNEQVKAAQSQNAVIAEQVKAAQMQAALAQDQTRAALLQVDFLKNTLYKDIGPTLAGQKAYIAQQLLEIERDVRRFASEAKDKDELAQKITERLTATKGLIGSLNQGDTKTVVSVPPGKAPEIVQEKDGKWIIKEPEKRYEVYVPPDDSKLTPEERLKKQLANPL